MGAAHMEPMCEKKVHVMTPGTSLRPMLLSADEREILTRLLSAVAGEFTTDARRLGGLLNDEERVGGAVTYTYGLADPWGSHGMNSEAHAIAECRAARAEHWAAGSGRDERYRSIHAYRTPHIYFEDGSEWRGEPETIDVPDVPLTGTDLAENQVRIGLTARELEVVYAHLRAHRTALSPEGATGRRDPDADPHTWTP